ncbi:hypothetical protein MO973_40485 [Paenibacillus sp. TRM 82003]|uniref:hypothetical protein n=1 Tax=Kineococcus sp. TRM81007 TaxID=2925831 RepID=UPI001F5A9D2C|nr:hypothetical protein [Kineococcus sp. TRM81007]MCI2237055.1 hypothetical protein [Kineococcus sp. TRM81007]MCI3926478.1 hypothetical protein [Paenibacillus sp. TRM 82003]
MSTTTDPKTTVEVLLAAAGLTVTPEEFDAIVRSYPDVRARIDAMYAVPMAKEEEPQLVFTPFV